MEVKMNKIFHELEITDFDTDNRSVKLLTGKRKKEDDLHKEYLNIYTSLMSASSGQFCNDLKKNEGAIHHFEWQFGVSAPVVKGHVFDWVGALREDRSICIQVLIETPGPDYECLVTDADMNGFKPLNTLKDESTNYFSLFGNIAGDIAPVPAFSKIIGRLTGQADKQDAAKHANRFKNMFRLFRFLTDKGEQGLEYVLNKDILSQWGTFLKGSFGLCFVSNAKGGPPPSSQYRIKVLPKLGFKKNDHLCFLPPPDQAEEIKAELAIDVRGEEDITQEKAYTGG